VCYPDMNTTAQTAIERAERILPGEAAPEGEHDARWQAIIDVADHVTDAPEAVWEFIARWGQHSDPDLRMAIATCALEHLLEHHFDAFLPRVAEAAHSNSAFADTVLHCWRFGQAEDPARAARLAELQAQCRRRLDNKQMQRTRRV
jgi:hypothetical protein